MMRFEELKHLSDRELATKLHSIGIQASWTIPPTVLRLMEEDVVAFADTINRQNTSDYYVVSRFPTGVYGAWLLHALHTDEQFVLKFNPEGNQDQWLLHTPAILDLLCSRGCPVPGVVAKGLHPVLGPWRIHNYLRGTMVDALDSVLLNQVLAFNDLQASLPLQSGYDWSSKIEADVYHDASDWIKALTQYSSEAASVAHAFRELIQRNPPCQLSRKDIVHGDFLISQMLFQSQHLTGVLDWDQAGYGDRGQDLTQLLYNVHAHAYRTGKQAIPNVVSNLAYGIVEIVGAEAFAVFAYYFALEPLAFVVKCNSDAIAWRTRIASALFDITRAYQNRGKTRL